MPAPPIHLSELAARPAPTAPSEMLLRIAELERRLADAQAVIAAQGEALARR